jgi:hypothetical protein
VIAEAYRWERLAFSGGLTKSLLKDGSLNLRMLGTPSAPSWMHQLGEIGEKLAEFTAGPFYMPLGDDLRFGQEVLRTAERRLRGESLAETPIPTNARISGMAVPNLFECGFTAVQANATAVRTRLAARLIADHRAGQPLPVDEPAFLARYGATCLDVPNGPRQHYERLSERRFRLSTPKTSPATTFFDPARITAISPPPTDERSVFAGWHVEITVRDSTPSSALPAGSTPASPQDSHP